jgi:hypothetical protein
LIDDVQGFIEFEGCPLDTKVASFAMLYDVQILVEFEYLMQCNFSLNLLDVMQGFLEVEF